MGEMAYGIFKKGYKRARTAKTSKSIVPVTLQQAESNLASKVVKLEKLVRGLKPEVKYIDVDCSTTNVPLTGSVIHLTPIAQGTAINTRVGDLVSTLWWELNFQARFTDSVLTSVSQDPSFRFYVIRDNQQAPDTAPTANLLVDQPAFPPIQLLELQSTMQKRFTVLYDSKPQLLNPGIFSVGTPNTSVVFPFKVFFNLHRKCKGQVRFNGANGTDQQKGALYLVVCSNMIDASVQPTFDFSGTSRVAYTDV